MVEEFFKISGFYEVSSFLIFYKFSIYFIFLMISYYLVDSKMSISLFKVAYGIFEKCCFRKG